MSKMNTNKIITFAAIKLIEELYRNGKISSTVLRNIVDEYSDVIDASAFDCSIRNTSKMEEEKCTI